MSEDALVQTQIDSDIRDRAEKVLQDAGMTIPDLLRLALTRTAEYGEVPYGLSSADDPEYDAWFRAQVQEALDDPGPSYSDEEMRAYMDGVKAEALKKLAEGKLSGSAGATGRVIIAKRSSSTMPAKPAAWIRR